MNIAKTNTGVDFFKGIEHKNQGSPDLRSKRAELGTIRDIKFPDTEKGRNGLQVIISFDNQKLGTPSYWFALGEDAGNILATVGNREAVLLAPPRVVYSYHPTNFHSGIAKIVCDNSYGTYSKYQNNPSINAVGPMSTLADGGSPHGQQTSLSIPGATVTKRNGKYYLKEKNQKERLVPGIPKKLTREEWEASEALLVKVGLGSTRQEEEGVSDITAYEKYEELYAKQLKNALYEPAIDFEAQQAASQAPAPIEPWEEVPESTIDPISSQPVVTAADAKKNILQGR